MRDRHSRRAGAVLAFVLLMWSTAARGGQFDLEQAVEVFHRGALDPANRAVAARDTILAARLVANVTSGLQQLHPTVRLGQATHIQRLARGYMEIRLYDEAATLLEAAAMALEPAAPIANESLALVLVDMARAHRLAGRSQAAEPLLARAQTLRRPTSSPDLEAFPLQAELAELRLERGDLAGAERLLRPVIAAADRIASWQHVPHLIVVFEAYAALLNRRGETGAAQTFTERAATIRRNMAVAEEEMRRFLERK